MKNLIIALISITTCSLLTAQVPKMPEPTAEHAWLKQYEGEWDVETEFHMEPGKPPMKAKATESARMLGGFWVVGDNKGEMMGAPFTGIMTIGYHPGKKSYVGTWVDSNTSQLWNYKGSVDATGKIPMLKTEGFCPMGGKVCRFKYTIEFKSKDHRVMTGTKLGKDGKWKTNMVINARRKS